MIAGATAKPPEVLSRWILASGMDVLCDLTRSHGAYLYDARSGSEYLDLFSFFGARALGFNHRKLVDPDFVERMGRVALHKPSNCDVYTPEYEAFVDRFCTGALGGAFAKVFFIEGGSPAVENAVKTAVDWKHHKNMAAGRGEKGTQIIHFAGGFHGRTGYALSLTDALDPRKTQFFPRFDWPRVSSPWMTFPFDEEAAAEVAEREAQSLREIEAAFDANPDDIAAIIIEPIQGEGGDRYFRTEFLAELRRLSLEREALLIFDEIQTGFGSTGTWWDWQHHGVKPDVMVFGKKTQVCGIAVTERVNEVDSVFVVPSRISSTFEGNLVDMVRCHRTIDIIEEDNLLDHAVRMGDYLMKLLEDLSRTFPEVSGVRGRGLWAAFDLPTREERDRVIGGCFEEYLIVMGCGEKSVRMRPALDIGADAIGRAVAQLEAGICRAYKRKALG